MKQYEILAPCPVKHNGTGEYREVVDARQLFWRVEAVRARFGICFWREVGWSHPYEPPPKPQSKIDEGRSMAARIREVNRERLLWDRQIRRQKRVRRRLYRNGMPRTRGADGMDERWGATTYATAIPESVELWAEAACGDLGRKPLTPGPRHGGRARAIDRRREER